MEVHYHSSDQTLEDDLEMDKKGREVATADNNVTLGNFNHSYRNWINICSTHPGVPEAEI